VKQHSEIAEETYPAIMWFWELFCKILKQMQYSPPAVPAGRFARVKACAQRGARNEAMRLSGKILRGKNPV